MNAHLTDEQLSAHHDGALASRERAAVEAHLTECEHCRGRLADLAALDASLAEALTYEPADAHFDALADRVAARVAAERVQPTGPRRAWGGWFAPRVLAWGGALAAVAVGTLGGAAWAQHACDDIGEEGWRVVASVEVTGIKDVTPVPHNGCRPRKKRRV